MPNRGKILLTWSGEKKFRYDGSVSTGITIQCGTGFSRHYSLNTSRLRQVVTLFAGREVRIGTHRTAPPEDSIGLWFQWPRVQIPPPTPKRINYSARLRIRSEEHTSELQSRFDLVCRLLLEKNK